MPIGRDHASSFGRTYRAWGYRAVAKYSVGMLARDHGASVADHDVLAYQSSQNVIVRKSQSMAQKKQQRYMPRFSSVSVAYSRFVLDGVS